MAQHTPAPWSTSDEGEYTLVYADSAQDYIASVHNYDSKGHVFSNSDANARLIAAAPELLMRLDDLCHGLEGIDLPGALPARLKKALAAIAKATE